MNTLTRSNLTSWTPLVEEIALAYAGNHTQDYEDAVQDGMVRLMEMATGIIPLPPRAKEWKPEHVFSQVRQAINSEYRKEATLPQSHTSESDIVLHNDDGSRIDGANEVLELLTEALEVSDGWMSPVIPSSAPQFELSCGHTKGLLGQFSEAFGEKEPYAMCPSGCGEMKVGRQIKTSVGEAFAVHETEEVLPDTGRDRDLDPNWLNRFGSAEDQPDYPEPTTKSRGENSAQREERYRHLEMYIKFAEDDGYLPTRKGFVMFTKKLELIGDRINAAYLEDHRGNKRAFCHDNVLHEKIVSILVTEGYIRPKGVHKTGFFADKEMEWVPLIALTPARSYKAGTYYSEEFIDEAFAESPEELLPTHTQRIGGQRTRRMDEWYAAIEGKKGRYYDRADFQVAKVKAMLTGSDAWTAGVLAYAHIFPYKGPALPVKAIRGSSLVLEDGSVIAIDKAWRCWTGLRFGSPERTKKFCVLLKKHFSSNKNARDLARILRNVRVPRN